MPEIVSSRFGMCGYSGLPSPLVAAFRIKHLAKKPLHLFDRQELTRIYQQPCDLRRRESAGVRCRRN